MDWGAAAPAGKPVLGYWWYRGISSAVEETHTLKVQAVKEIFFMHCTAYSSSTCPLDSRL
jgi:hypothetical protein